MYCGWVSFGLKYAHASPASRAIPSIMTKIFDGYIFGIDAGLGKLKDRQIIEMK